MGLPRRRGRVAARGVEAEVGVAGQFGKYLHELLIWRELAYAFCYYRPNHDSLAAIPRWAVDTLREHELDPRPALPDWETLARGRTGDPLRDAAQRSLLIQGELHNNVRMTWGKAFLNWTANAADALVPRPVRPPTQSTAAHFRRCPHPTY